VVVLNQNIKINHSICLTIKREDLIHPFVSGNKFRKLKYNLLQAKAENKTKILTFGGAFSNHIAATAFAGKENNFQTIGIIRGEELWDKIDENPTLKFAQNCGMQFKFVSRANFDLKKETSFLDKLQHEFGNFYLLPEGGTNDLAIKGCEEILSESDKNFDYICCSIGTGGTISGIINSASENQKILGFPALKGDFLEKEICKFAKNKNYKLISNYHFGGYAKTTPELIDFINDFHKTHQILLDPIYTGKMIFGIMDLIKKDFFKPNSKILAIHTGGIQGIAGMNTI
jgi:1-aminocyclopropane-1-carboxylate deaminase